MKHFKLVAGTESPTRYTKIIRNPGADTKYNRTYQETDFISRYTKTAAPGIGYTPPAIPEPEYEPPSEATKAYWRESNVYEIGQTVEAFSGTFQDGNPDTQSYRSRWQERETAGDSWINTSWNNHPNEQTKFSREITKVGQIRFQTQCRDDTFDPVAQENSFVTVKYIEPLPTSIGAPSLTVDDVAHTYGEVIHCVVNQSLRFHMSTDGDADPSFKWEARGSYSMLISEQAASTILTFPEQGSVTLTCTITDYSATDSPLTYAMSVYVASEAEWEITHPNN